MDFNIGRFELGLQPESKPTPVIAESVISYWDVDNIQESYDSLVELGTTENEAPYSVGSNIITATVKDHFGNIIGLIYNPHFKINS